MRVLLPLLLVVACSGQIRDGERIAKTPLILKQDEAQISQSLPWKEKMSPAAVQLNDQAVDAVRDLRLDEAEDLFRKSFEESPLYGLPYLNLARLYSAAGETASAQAVYAKLAKAPFKDEELLAAADWLYAMTLTEDAVGLLENLSQQKRAGFLPSLRLANHYLGIADYARADANYDQVLMKKPQHPDALFGRGYVRYLAGDFSAAALFFEDARKNGSREPELCRFYLNSLYRTNRLEKARTEFAGCSGSDPDLAEIRIRILLTLDPFAKVDSILGELKREDAAALEQKLFGTNNRGAADLIRAELELGY